MRVGDQRVFAGENKGLFREQIIDAGQNDVYPMQTIYVDFEQKEAGEINIGVTTDNAPAETWFKIDNFRLFRSQVSNDPATAVNVSPQIDKLGGNYIYTLGGIRVNQMKKSGIYILNHKKILKH